MFCKRCKKRGYKSKFDAITFQQSRYNKPYYVYPCPHAPGEYWHISTNGISDKTEIELAKMIQNSDSFIIERKNKSSTHLVEHRSGTFLVHYSKRSHKAKILSEVYI